LLFFLSFQLNAQLTVTTGTSPSTLVQNVLVGEGVTVSNITFQGSTAAIGKFQTGSMSTNLGLKEGIVISTGAANNTIGSYASNFASTDLGRAGYSLLTNLAGIQTYDAAVLQFDFVPQSDTIRFRYVFSSEEYHEYVNDYFNDVFGFFITGPNPIGANYYNKNIALIPNSSTPISINTVNNGYSLYDCSYGPCKNCAYFVDNCYGNSIVYDAFTKVLTAWAVVEPCKKYTIIIAIADAGDHLYDSAVFLEANSFSSDAVGIHITSSNPVAGEDAIVGCNNTMIEFCLPKAQPTDCVVNYTIGGSAVNGVHYETIPNSITIPAGQTCAKLEIIPIDNGSVKGKEIVQLTVQTSPCAQETVTVNILEYTEMEISTNGTTSICEGNINSVPIGVNVNKGVSPYSYNWDNGLPSLQNHNVNPTQTTTYNVTVTDACGHSLSSDATITVLDNADISIDPDDPTICLGSEITLTVNGATSYTWSTGEATQKIIVKPSQTTTYTVSGTDIYGCSGSTSTTVHVEPELALDINASPPEICLGGSTILQAQGAKHYTWDNGQKGETITVSPTQNTTYSVTGTDDFGCIGTSTITITVYPAIVINITPNNPEICDGDTITLNANGADTYIWCNSQSGNTYQVSPSQTTTYSVTGTDTMGCTATTSAKVIVNPKPTIQIKADQYEVCTGTPVLFNVAGANSYSWNNGANSDSFVDTLINTTTYSVTGTDQKGCKNSSSLTIDVFYNLTLTVTPNNPNICKGDTVTLLVTSNGTNPTFLWNTGETNSSVTTIPDSTITYTIDAIDQYGCIGDTITTITVFPIPDVDFSANPLLGCIPVSVSFTSISDSDNSYLWSFGDGTTCTEQHPLHTYIYSGNYSVLLTVNSPHNCTNSILKHDYINAYPVPFADFITMPSVATEDNPTISFFDKSIGANNWFWTFEDGNFIDYSYDENPIYTYTNIGKHQVELIVENQWGCSDTAKKTVQIKPITTFYIPNAFTPDEDGINDIFIPYGYNVDEDNYSMSIYDRTGNIVFHTTNLHEGWNGKKQNNDSKIMPIGTYTYRIKTSFNNIEEVFTGTLTLYY